MPIIVNNFKDINSYTFTLPAKYENLYFYVKQIINGQIADSNIIEINNENGVIDWNDPTDSDGDGISDVYETQTYLTDPNKADTDGDGLEDGTELFYFSTDPTKVDTDGNGINDGDEDSDKDGLSNATEIKLGTDPFVEDSDSDTLKDGDEVNKHSTDPTKYDTDGDGISDADEIALGLDPNATYTDGVADNQKTTEQVISADSESLKDINGLDDNPYDVSLEIKAAGLASSSLSSRTSSYSEVIKSDAVIGVVPEFTYSNDLNVEDVVIKFKIDDSMVNNTVGTYSSTSEEFKGIKRINVFKYFEEYNMLLPIETFHDTATNTVYTHVDELGTYCLMDIEIWLDSLATDEKQEDDCEVVYNFSDKSTMTVENSPAMYYKESADGWNTMTVQKSDCLASKQDEEINVDYLVDVRDVISPTEFDQIKQTIKVSSKQIYEKSNGKVTFRIISFGYSGTSLVYPQSYLPPEGLESYTMVESAIDSLSQQSTSDKNNNKAVLTTAYDGAFRFTYNSAPKYFFTFIGSDENAVYEVKKGNEIISKLTQPNDIIDTSIITSYNIDTATEMSGYAFDVASQSNGMIIRGWNCSTTLVNHIYKENTNPNVILMGGMKQLPSNFGPLSATSTRDYDDDGLKDTEEINFEASYKGGYNLIYFEDDGTVILPTYNECMTFFKDEKFYIEKGLERFQNSSEYLTFNGDTTYVLPINSDPTNVDGDGDEILDKRDCRALKTDVLPDKFIDSINQGLMEHELVKSGYQDLLVVYKGVISEKLFCNITGKSLNINPKYSLYAYKDSNGSYVYKFSTEKMTDEELNEKYFYIDYVLVMKYMVNKIKEETAHDGTVSIGGVGSVSIGGVINFSGQLALSSDAKGNRGLQFTCTSGVGGPASIGVGGNVGASISITDAPDIKKLEGFSTTIGGSCATPNGGAGGDIILFNDDQGNSYMGLSASLLTGAELEGHVNGNYTYTLIDWNIYDIFDSKSDDLLNILTIQDE